MARGLWRGRSQALPWVTAAGATVATVSLGVPQAYGIVVGALIGLAACALMRRKSVAVA
ncbi:AzlC-like protein [Sagittula stellata E-37]|uniref:AzlC-like protein n=1 Tax=Sagittula stellata (strain ATCC 700073 / DSM 11524 / E-37) TaxID=388399 RepID=A3K4M6_SAGS3|nr:AzlC-like protein [Sagittula stellata E-37]